MKIQEIRTYKKYGCNWSGNLALVDYQKEWENDPNKGRFGSMSIFNHTETATKMVKEKYPDCDVLLSVPDVVVRIDWSFV